MHSPKPGRGGFLPVFVAGIVTTFSLSILKMLLVLAVPAVVLLWFGQPALLIQSWSHGPRSYPVYDECLYIALDGMHVVIPGYGGASADCPAVKLVPADLRKLIWG